MLQGFFDKKILALDTETTGLSWRKDRIVIVSISDGKHSYAFTWKELEKKGDLKRLQIILGDKETLKIFHNAKFDIHMFLSAELGPVKNIADTYIMSVIYDENLPSHKLKDLAIRYVDPAAKDAQVDLKMYMKEKGMRDFDCSKIPDRILKPYAVMDAFYTYKLYEFFEPTMLKNFKDVYTLETRLIPLVVEMERRGIQVDLPFLEGQGKMLAKKIKPLEKVLKDTLGNINFSSNEQVAIALDNMKIEVSKTPKGNPKLDKYELDRIDHPVAKKIKEYRQMTHLLATYCEGMPEHAFKGILHCGFRQVGARTGRFSCAEPNLQNIPRELADIRSGFTVRKGFINYHFDYSQVEMRLLAHYCEDPLMLKIIADEGDVHLDTACHFFEKPPEDITKDERYIGKHLNFAVIYGMGAKGLSQKFKVAKDKAYEYLTKYYSLYPAVKEFRDAATQKCQTSGYVFTSWGRHRRLRYDESYKAVNAIIQGSAADLIKDAMIRVADFLKGKKSNILLQIHDELIIEIAKEELNLVPKIKQIMEDFGKRFSVPIVVDVKHTETNWGDLKGD